MADQELVMAGIMFENKIYSCEGQKFEDLFIAIMTNRNPNFEAVKAYGKEGDHKNDGFDKTKGTYYQVFAPENIKKPKTINEAVKKLEKDFTGLYGYWNSLCPIKSFYFVINDKFKGIPAPIQKKCLELRLQKKYKNIKIDLFTAKDLRKEFNALSKEEMCQIIGNIPDSHIDTIKIDALSRTIKYISNMKFKDPSEDELVVPEFNEKIKFNGLSDSIKAYLNSGSYQEGILKEYFNNEPGTDEIVQKKFHALYLESKEKYNDNNKNYSNNRFAYILEKASTEDTIAIKSCVLVLMAYYFASCDIFESPT